MKTNLPIVTLLTDFGTEDGYVGAIKGILLRHQPDLQIVDITHNIEAYNIRQAAFAIVNYAYYYPKGTIHIVVVDPGVGSKRKGLIIKAASQYFIGPDNGVFSFLFQEENFKAFEIDESMVSSTISPTFHGRDVFAPAALKLCEGYTPDQFCHPASNISAFYDSYTKISDREFTLKVIHIDHFGNLVLNFKMTDWEAIGSPQDIKTQIKHCFIYGIKQTFSEVEEGQILVIWDSSGFLQISQFMGDASRLLHMSVGDEVRLLIE